MGYLQNYQEILQGSNRPITKQYVYAVIVDIHHSKLLELTAAVDEFVSDLSKVSFQGTPLPKNYQLPGL